MNYDARANYPRRARKPLWHETGTGWLVTDGRAHIHIKNPVKVER